MAPSSKTTAARQDQDVIKHHNKRLVLDLIRSRRPISRAEIAKQTQMSATSAGRIVAELAAEGLVKETETASEGLGRKAVMLDVVADGRYAVGVDMQKKRIRIGVMDLSERLVGESDLPHAAHLATPEETIALLAEAIRSLLAERRIPAGKVAGIGIGTPGVIDFERGVVRLSSTLGWRDAALAEVIGRLTGIRTVIDNDLKASLLGEHRYGAAQHEGKTALIHVGTGVGAALLLDGAVFRGGTNGAGELGHMTLNPHGPLCECGKRGCLQTYVDEAALLAEARTTKGVRDIGELYEADRRGEAWAGELLERAALHIAVAINNLVCLFNPDTILLGGELFERCEAMIERVRRHCEMAVWEPLRQSLRIAAAALGRDSVALGAGALAMEQGLINGNGKED